jgi:hypothetical protein
MRPALALLKRSALWPKTSNVALVWTKSPINHLQIAATSGYINATQNGPMSSAIVLGNSE